MFEKISDKELFLQQNRITKENPHYSHLDTLIDNYNEAVTDIENFPPFPSAISSMEKLRPYKKLSYKYGIEPQSGRINVGHFEMLKAKINSTCEKKYSELLEKITNSKAINYKSLHSRKIFWSWQSHYSKSRSEIEDSLNKAIEYINDKEFLTKLSIEIAMRPEDGVNPIDQNIINKVRNCRYFISDVTPIFCWSDKGDTRRVFYPNPNICVETGYALEMLEPTQIMLISKRRKEDDFKHGQFPFDISHRPIISYGDPAFLTPKIIHAISTSLKVYRDISDEQFIIIEEDLEKNPPTE